MKKQPVTYDTIRQLALTLPDTEESTSYGTPAIKVKGKLLLRLHDDRDKVVLKMPFDRREELMAGDPETYFITDHYRDYPWVLVVSPMCGPTRCAISCSSPIAPLHPRRNAALDLALRSPDLSEISLFCVLISAS